MGPILLFVVVKQRVYFAFVRGVFTDLVDIVLIIKQCASDGVQRGLFASFVIG